MHNGFYIYILQVLGIRELSTDPMNGLKVL